MRGSEKEQGETCYSFASMRIRHKAVLRSRRRVFSMYREKRQAKTQKGEQVTERVSRLCGNKHCWTNESRSYKRQTRKGSGSFFFAKVLLLAEIVAAAVYERVCLSADPPVFSKNACI